MLLAPARGGAASPAEAFRALQKAAEARDVDAIEAALTPRNREIFREELKRDGLDTLAGNVPHELSKLEQTSDDDAVGEAPGRVIEFERVDGRWYVRRLTVIDDEPSVRVEGQPVATVKPAHGAGMPNKQTALSGGEAYELLLAKAKSVRRAPRLYSLDTGMNALSADGRASGWSAEFLTEKPGEMLTIGYEEGEVDEEPFVSEAPAGRDGVPEPDAIGYDTKKLYDETVRRAAGKVDPISRVTASLYRSAGSGKALWLLNVYGDDDRIGTTVVFEAKTMGFSHQTK